MRKATLERQEMDAFARYWEDLFHVFPEARRKAVEAMGETVQKDLKAQIQAAELESSAKGTVRSWQTTRMGSRGGYAAVSPIKGTVMSRDRRKGGWKMRQHTYKGKPITAKQVTRWLERGHGTPPTGQERWSYRNGRKTMRKIQERQGEGYVRGRQFYSFTKAKAWEHARNAAEKLLSSIADEVDF